MIRKALNAGYLLDFRPNYDIVGTPQGYIVSPILANIYLHQLDEFVENLKTEFDSVGIGRKRHPIVRKHQWKISKAKQSGADSAVIRKLAVELRNNPNKLNGPHSRKLLYVRYADDWIIAVNGSFKETKAILAKVTQFCKSIGLTVSPEKTKLTNSYKNQILFLGTSISHSKSVTYSYHRKGYLQRNSGFLVLKAPMDRIYKKLREAGFMKNHKGVTKVSWLQLEVRQILHLANSIIRGYENYYSFVFNKGQLCTYLYYIIRDVVLSTLANKLSLGTRAKVIKKFGPELKIFNQEKRDNNNKPTLVAQMYKPSYRINLWDFKNKPVNTNIKILYSNDVSLARLDLLNCVVCNSNYKVEKHHVRKMKDLKRIKGSLDYLMIKARRKQIPLCRSCHMDYHRGELKFL